MFLAINKNVVEMGSVLRGQGDHGGVCHNSRKTVRQPFQNSLEARCGYEWLPFAVAGLPLNSLNISAKAIRCRALQCCLGF